MSLPTTIYNETTTKETRLVELKLLGLELLKLEIKPKRLMSRKPQIKHCTCLRVDFLIELHWFTLSPLPGVWVASI